MKKFYYIILFILTLFAIVQLDLLGLKSSIVDASAKPQLQSSLSTLHNESNAHSSEYDNDKSDEVELSNAQSIPLSNDQQHCIDLCKLYFDKLQFGFELTDEDILYIDKNIELFAAQLHKNPHLAASLIPQLFADENPQNQNHIKAVEAIIANLKDEQKVHIAQALVNTDPSSNMQVAMKLLSNSVINTEIGFEVFKQVLNNATDQRTLNRALNLIPRITEQSQKLALLDSLTKVMHDSNHTHTYGVSLMAKVAITTEPALVYSDVIEAIEHIDDDAKFYGLKAIETILEQETSANNEFNDTKSAEWASNSDIQLALVHIVHDDTLPVNIRNKAQDLMEDYY